MGQVWKARDTRLNRTVAIKTSNRGFDERFEREAQAIAALNHPNICTLYDIGPDYLVMELVDGKPIAGPLPIEETLKLGGQILDALDAAHREGIIHRDLKPGNLLRGKNGIKVLDFGLAKFARPALRAAAHDDTTMSLPLTQEGTIVGTPQYMAPEQIEGKEADARSDIFSFGVVLYELIAGKRPFTGANQANVLASILKDQPRPLLESQPLTPPALERVVQTCLEKDPDKRWQSAREIKHALEWSGNSLTSGPVTSRKKFPIWQTAATVLGLAAAGALAYTYLRPAAAPAETVRLQVPLPKDTAFSVSGRFAISPDGKRLVFSAIDKDNVARLWLRSLDSVEAKPIEGTEHDPRLIVISWSPDSRQILFGRFRIQKVDVNGGAPQMLAQLPAGADSASWSKDGTILLGSAAGIRRLEASGETTLVTAADETRKEGGHGDPVMLPDGRHFLYTRHATSPENGGVYVGSLDDKPSGQDLKRLLPADTHVSYVDIAGGKLLFYRSGTLLAQSFDLGRRELSGDPVTVLDQVDANPGFAYWSVSAAGVLVYRTGGASIHRALTWFDRHGKILGTVGEPGLFWTLRLSPDGIHVAYGVDDPASESRDIFVMDTERGSASQLTPGGQHNLQPQWSPDGRRIAWGRTTPQPPGIFQRAADGSSQEEAIVKGDAVRFPGSMTQWTNDGRYLLAFGGSGPTKSDIWAMPLPSGPAIPVVRTAGSDIAGYVSPNGRWIAYRSDESGRNELLVQPFLPNQAAQGSGSASRVKWMVSKGGSLGMARWRKDGRELLYLATDGTIMAVPVTTDSDFTSGTPVALFQLPKSFMALFSRSRTVYRCHLGQSAIFGGSPGYQDPARRADGGAQLVGVAPATSFRSMTLSSLRLLKRQFGASFHKSIA